MTCLHEVLQGLGASDLQQDDGVNVLVELVHMVHEMCVLLDMMPGKVGHITCIRHDKGMDGDVKSSPICHGTRTPRTACGKD